MSLLKSISESIIFISQDSQGPTGLKLTGLSYAESKSLPRLKCVKFVRSICALAKLSISIVAQLENIRLGKHQFFPWHSLFSNSFCIPLLAPPRQQSSSASTLFSRPLILEELCLFLIPFGQCIFLLGLHYSLIHRISRTMETLIQQGRWHFLNLDLGF